MEAIFNAFDELLTLIVTKYKISRRNLAINDLYLSIKRIYSKPETFKYVFERFYSNPQNPFTTAYHEFMNYKNSGYDDDDIFYFLAERILERKLHEQFFGEFKTF